MNSSISSAASSSASAATRTAPVRQASTPRATASGGTSRSERREPTRRRKRDGRGSSGRVRKASATSFAPASACGSQWRTPLRAAPVTHGTAASATPATASAARWARIGTILRAARSWSESALSAVVEAPTTRGATAEAREPFRRRSVGAATSAGPAA